MPLPTTGAVSTVKSVASFAQDSFTNDPLVIGDDVISQSANIAAGQGVLKRGQVLLGPVHGTPILAGSMLTITPGAGLEARAVLAQDIDTGPGTALGLIYTAGEFLDTSLIFTAQGGPLDSAQLWLFDIHVLTVMQRSGKLVPMMSLPVAAGPMPASVEEEAEAKDADGRERERDRTKPGDHVEQRRKS